MYISRHLVLRLLLVLLVAGIAFEAWRVWNFYQDLETGRSALLALRDDLELSSLSMERAEVERIRADLEDATAKLDSAKSFADNDLFLFLGAQIPFAGDNLGGLKELVTAADAAGRSGLAATEVIIAYDEAGDSPDKTSVQEAIDLLQSQREPMQRVRAGLDEMQRSYDDIPGDVAGPIADARTDLGEAIDKLSALVEGYERAAAFLPGLLGYGDGQSYLVLMQNDTEIFPSGGLISNYGVATFEDGLLTHMEFEYFINLFDRWQATSGGEYVEPPQPLQDYLLQDVSWALGEAGWYPDFPTTANLATDFVQKGGVAPTDGTIAIDMQFVEAIIGVVGPITVPDYGVTVDASNLSEVTLEQTRGEKNQPGAPQKAFLSSLARDLMAAIFALPKDQWINMLQTLDRMGRERHLQINFTEEGLQSLSRDYVLDGSIVEHDGDFLLLADTSVLSTKLNLILETSIDHNLQIHPDSSVTAQTAYTMTNPVTEWSAGRDPELVTALMKQGVYGSYLRLYGQPDMQVKDVRVDGRPTGASQLGEEVGKRVIGRFSQVLPGETKRVDFLTSTPDVVARGDVSTYSLYVQKQPGTSATPFNLTITLPPGTELVQVLLDGKPAGEGHSLSTDLTTDRLIQVEYQDAD